MAELRPGVARVTRRNESPPFRAEHIGSLLRPEVLLNARARFIHGEIVQSELTVAEHRAIRDAVALQRQLGFGFVTDGEFRRRAYHSFFYQQLGDITIDVVDGASISGAGGKSQSGRRGTQPMARIKSRVHWTHPINVADFEFLKANTDLIPKITSPGRAHCISGVAMRR